MRWLAGDYFTSIFLCKYFSPFSLFPQVKIVFIFYYTKKVEKIFIEKIFNSRYLLFRNLYEWYWKIPDLNQIFKSNQITIHCFGGEPFLGELRNFQHPVRWIEINQTLNVKFNFEKNKNPFLQDVGVVITLNRFYGAV